MQSAEEFMRQLFDEKIEMEKQRLERVVPFRRKFFTQDCDYGSRPGVLEQFQSEEVQSISVLDSEAEVITTQTPFYVDSTASLEMRYLLRTDGDSWLIYEVDLRCCSCDGQPAKADCPCCHGTGWRNTNVKAKCSTYHLLSPDGQQKKAFPDGKIYLSVFASSEPSIRLNFS